MGYYNGPRRYYLRKAQQAERDGDAGLAGAWRAKQRALPSLPLPADFPFAKELAEQGYLGLEDLNGATVTELSRIVRLNTREGERVLAAFAALLI